MAGSAPLTEGEEAATGLVGSHSSQCVAFVALVTMRRIRRTGVGWVVWNGIQGKPVRGMRLTKRSGPDKVGRSGPLVFRPLLPGLPRVARLDGHRAGRIKPQPDGPRTEWRVEMVFEVGQPVRDEDDLHQPEPGGQQLGGGGPVRVRIPVVLTPLLEHL